LVLLASAAVYIMALIIFSTVIAPALWGSSGCVPYSGPTHWFFMGP
jgi:hypothetical protein